MLLGSEFPPPPHRTTEAGWQAFTELLDKQAKQGMSRAVAKFRLGASEFDVVQARNLGAQVLWRPRQESPTENQLASALNDSKNMIQEGDWLELENEPNHTNSKWLQEGMTPTPYLTNLHGLVGVALSNHPMLELVSPGLMPESNPTSRSNTVRWITMSSEARMRCDLQGGHVYHTAGLDGIMYLPKTGEVVTEFGYSGGDPRQAVVLNNRVLRVVMDRGAAAVVFFILPYAEGEGEWGQYFLTVSAARSYREEHERWHALNDKEDDVTDQERAELREKILELHRAMGAPVPDELVYREIRERWAQAWSKVGDAVNYLDSHPKATVTAESLTSAAASLGTLEDTARDHGP